MSESVTGDVSSRPSMSNPSHHARHDELLVVRYAASDAGPAEHEQARELVNSCEQCEALASDIALLSRAAAQLPAPRRSMDFRLSQEQAKELRGSFLGRLLGRLAAPRVGAALRPIAGVAMSLGIVLAVAGTSLPQAAMPAAAPAPLADQQQEFAAPGDQVRVDQPEMQPEAQEPRFDNGSAAEQPDQRDVTAGLDGDEGEASEFALQQYSPVEPVGNPLFYIGALVALVSLGVLLLSWIAGRRERLLR